MYIGAHQYPPQNYTMPHNGSSKDDEENLSPQQHRPPQQRHNHQQQRYPHQNQQIQHYHKTNNNKSGRIQDPRITHERGQY
jgi:hypothetical protein